MLLFAILAVAIVLVMSFAILVVGAGSAVGLIIFSDLIVCVALIVWLIKRAKKKK